MLRWGKRNNSPKILQFGINHGLYLDHFPVVPLPPYHMLSIKPHQGAKHSYPGWENHHAGIRAQEEEFNPLITDAPAPCDICNRLKQFTMYYLSVPVIGLCFTFVVQSLSHVGLCDPTDCSTPGFPVLHYRPEFAQTHVHWVDDAIQPSHPLSLPSPPAFNLSQHQALFQWAGSLHQVAKTLELQLQSQSFRWIFRVDFL